MKSIVATAVLMGLLWVCQVPAGPADTKKNTRLFVSLDACSFSGDEGQSLWEIYYAVPDSSLKYVYTESGWKSEVLYDVRLMDKDNPVVQSYWITEHTSKEQPRGFSEILSGSRRFSVAPGQYKLIFSMQDLNDTTQTLTVETPVVVRSYSADRSQVSDIELASSIEEIDGSQPVNEWIKKGNLAITPNPELLYVGTSPQLLAYFEVYNGKRYFPDSMAVDVSIINRFKEVVYTNRRVRIPKADRLGEIVILPVDSLPSGIYNLQVAVHSAAEESARPEYSTKKFYIVNPDQQPEVRATLTEDQSFAMSEFATLTEEQVKVEWEMAQPIAVAIEKETFEKLTDHRARQRFLHRFWLARDPDRESIVNEGREEFRNRVETANKLYRSALSPEGWRSDRGRVVRQYGMPSLVERYPLAHGQRPHEVWFYENIQGGVKFVFCDLSGINHYVLIHSDARGEISDPNWKEKYINIMNMGQQSGSQR